MEDYECMTVGDILDALEDCSRDTPVLIALDMQDEDGHEQGMTMPLRKVAEVAGGGMDGALVMVPWMPDDFEETAGG